MKEWIYISLAHTKKQEKSLKELIQKRGAGSSIYNQLKTEGRISQVTFISWVITEMSGLAVLNFLKNDFETVNQVEHYLSLFKFRIEKQPGKSLGYLFALIEDHQDELNIEEYALSQTTLDQIFTAFAIEGESMQGEIDRSRL